jgi:hypothetical protein
MDKPDDHLCLGGGTVEEVIGQKMCAYKVNPLIVVAIWTFDASSRTTK